MSKPAKSAGAEIKVAVLLDESTLLLYGRTVLVPPPGGTAYFEGGTAARGIFSATSWVRRDAGGQGEVTWFLIVLRFENIAQVRASSLSLKSQDGAAEFPLPEAPRIQLEAGGLLQAMQPEMPEHAGMVLQFLRGALLESDFAKPSPRATRFLFDFLQAMAQPDGFVEMCGRLPGAELALQGWSFHLASGGAELILEVAACASHRALVGDYQRTDLAPSARGFIAVLHGAGGPDLRSLRRVYFRAGGGLYYLDQFDSRLVLDEAEAVLHVRNMLPQLRLDAAMAKSFRRVCNARYRGHETVTQLVVPARAAVDLAVLVPETGIFLAGWVLDPTNLVRAATLRTTGGFAARLDDKWHPVMRPDVSESFADEALFRGRLRPDHHAHGYIAYIPCSLDAAGAGEFYLELELENEEFAFIPVQLSDMASLATVRRVLSSFNVKDPAAESIVARHIGPIVTAAVKRITGPEIGVAASDFGPRRQRPGVSVIVPVTQARSDLDINFAKLATDREFESVELLVVAPLRLADHLGPLLRQYSDFYGLSGRLVLVADAIDRFEMLELGARLATAELMLFLSPSVLPKQGGWLGKLASGLRYSNKAGVISPTLIYEDYSIKFAGGGGGDSGLALRNLVRPQYAGYAKHWLRQRGISLASVASADCCLMRRKLFADIGGFSKDFVGPNLKDLDLSLKVRSVGMDCLWASDLEMFAVDEPEIELSADYWVQTGQLVDRWGFNRKWSRFFAKSGNVQ